MESTCNNAYFPPKEKNSNTMFYITTCNFNSMRMSGHIFLPSGQGRPCKVAPILMSLRRWPGNKSHWAVLAPTLISLAAVNLSGKINIALFIFFLFFKRYASWMGGCNTQNVESKNRFFCNMWPIQAVLKIYIVGSSVFLLGEIEYNPKETLYVLKVNKVYAPRNRERETRTRGDVRTRTPGSG